MTVARHLPEARLDVRECGREPPLTLLEFFQWSTFAQRSSTRDVFRGPWKKNSTLHSVIRVIISGGNLCVFENLAQTLVAVDTS